MDYYRKLPLKGRAVNVRDLGGYAASSGVTRFGRVLRSDDPSGYSPEDVRFLLDYGVRTAVDLRGKRETAACPHPLSGLEGVAYHSIRCKSISFF